MQYYAISYKRIEHPRILVSAGGPETNHLRIPRDSCICLPTCLFILITQSVIPELVQGKTTVQVLKDTSYI